MLIGDLSKLFKCSIRKKAEENNLSDTYRLIIFYLANHNGGTQLDLVNFTRCKAPTISLTLQKMEQEGLVERVQSKEDARKTLVYLTEKGFLYDQKMIEIFKTESSRILSMITDEEKEQLERILAKLVNAMCQEKKGDNNENI
jgi:DNA-binding MarR family transcriptional regulator